ncbi:MAG: cobalt-precorrin 5A hydrolase [Dehalococcoidia bacterium]
MAPTGIVAMSRRGAELAQALAQGLSGENRLYLDRRFHQGDATAFDLPLRPVLERLFAEYQSLVLFMPLGAAVRLLAPSLQHKHHDPAVVCVDDAGRFAVSLLSGHMGGADRLAQEVAAVLGATPVITSASHVTDTLAVDLLGQEFGWQLEADSVTITRASAAVVNGEPVGVYQEAGEPDWWPSDRPLPENVSVFTSLEALANSECVAALVVSDRVPSSEQEAEDLSEVLQSKHAVVYRPRSLVAGMGCRRGVSAEHLEQLLVVTFQQHGLALASLSCLASADLKQDEAGLLQLAEKYGVPLSCFSADELNSIFPLAEASPGTVAGTTPDQAVSPTPSAVARRLIGVWGVSEPAALLASGSRELLVTREKTDRATIAVARIDYHAR